ncbi:hypothetical protein EW026_g1794 [Hermanssonia centrifuga]|uniref:Transcriptional coactivator p15 (PC4) C-terminal domain-containing protein n=1 Tax=Hermanssonia centrifuga TaxID=98765 RepID=A0A4S4KS30_9APHY|nr:hypothetical protein EW026_g1794 [Hermanssonia centrifuga]
MVKRKPIIDSDEEEAIPTASESEEEKPIKSKAKSKSKVTARIPIYDNSTEGSEEEETSRPAKKKKTEQTAPKKSPKKSQSGGDEEAGALLVNATGDKYLDLGRRRRATISSFKGTALLDIREFYDAGGEERPGKKGISLQLDQWEVLKANADLVDSLFAKMKKK